MVSITEVRASNTSLTSLPRTAFFAGATSGIGKATLAALVNLKTPVKVYVAGRRETSPKLQPFFEELRRTNPSAEIIWLDAELSLLAEAKRVADVVRSKEERLDAVCLSQGYAPFGDRKETKEGLELGLSLSYYSRVFLILQFLPLLSRSPHPRVLTILGGHLMSPISDLSDLQLAKPGAFNGIWSQKNAIAMTNLFLERLADEQKESGVVFVHSHPGFVNTGNIRRGWGEDSWKSIAIDMVARPAFWAMGTGLEESGERHLFLLTSGRFGGDGKDKAKNSKGKQGPGLFLASAACDARDLGKSIEEQREKAQGVVWEETMKVFKPYL